MLAMCESDLKFAMGLQADASGIVEIFIYIYIFFSFDFTSFVTAPRIRMLFILHTVLITRALLCTMHLEHYMHAYSKTKARKNKKANHPLHTSIYKYTQSLCVCILYLQVHRTHIHKPWAALHK